MITPSRQTNSLQTYSKKYISILNKSWYSALEATRWLQNLSALIKSACTIVEAVDVEGRSTLIHCSDGWDRTPQLASLAQLLLDPYYRTIKVRKRVNLLFCFILSRIVEWFGLVDERRTHLKPLPFLFVQN